MSILANRIEFVYFFEVINGNPNGDPDAGNMPRIDPETGRGLVTDVCLKRKVRNFVDMAKEAEAGFDIYVREKAVLNDINERAYKALELKPESKKLPKEQEQAKKLTKWMCQNFFDIRTFGAVMTTEVNCGQVRGPVQFSFGQSLEPIHSMDVTITRMAVTNKKDIEKERTMGRKSIIPYALYRSHGYISANLAQQTGFTVEDKELLWQSLINMFDHDHSAARGQMSARKLFVFEHSNKMGDAPAHVLFDCIKTKRCESSEPGLPARSFDDYEITVEKDMIPDGIQLDEKL